MYKIILHRYNRWFEEQVIVEHTFSTKEQAERLFDGKHKLKSRDDISRQIVFDADKDQNSPKGTLIEEKKY